jgi:hypothetical protein
MKAPDYVTILDLPSGRRYEVRIETTGQFGRRQQFPEMVPDAEGKPSPRTPR